MDSEETVVADQEQAPTMVAEPKKKDGAKSAKYPGTMSSFGIATRTPMNTLNA